MVGRRRLPSSSYNSPIEEECWLRCLFAEQPIVIIDEHHDATQVARHVANKQIESAPFFVMDIPSVTARVDDWNGHLTRVRAFYALKCNADPVLARLLTDYGSLGFAVSDTQELAVAIELVPPEQIIFDFPVYTRKSMKIAGECGVGTIVIDNEKQLMDTISYAPHASILLAVSFDFTSNDPLIPNKGASLAIIEELMLSAFELRAKVVGISFDLGGATPRCFFKALSQVRTLFALATKIGLELNTINLGGGFPASNGEKEQRFTDLCESINNGLGQFFPLNQYPHLNVFATPGRYFASAAFVLCTNVIGKQSLDARCITKDEFDNGVGFVYQTNDSIYESFGCLLMNSQPQCIPLNDVDGAPQHFGTILGASLQPGDVAQSLVCCRQLLVGDWLLWRDAGAYTMPLNAEYALPPVYYYAGSKNWARIVERNTESNYPKTNTSVVADTASDGASDVESLDEESI